MGSVDETRYSTDSGEGSQSLGTTNYKAIPRLGVLYVLLVMMAGVRVLVLVCSSFVNPRVYEGRVKGKGDGIGGDGIHEYVNNKK
jgi:hypothetical protein